MRRIMMVREKEMRNIRIIMMVRDEEMRNVTIVIGRR